MPTTKKKGGASAEAAAPERIGLNNLTPSPGSHRDRKRLGRGPGSGKGKTSGKGVKGSKARTGHGGPGGGKPHFEGGQMPLTRRLPKRGFTPPFRVENQEVSLGDLSRVPAGTEITQTSLTAAGLVDDNKGPAKLLANGEISQAVTVRGVKVSASAREKIVAAGGKVEEAAGGKAAGGRRQAAGGRNEAGGEKKEARSGKPEAGRGKRETESATPDEKSEKAKEE